MKKLEISQMEDLQGTRKNRDCMIVGGLTVAGTIVGGFAGVVPGVGALIAGLMTGASMGCFS